MEENSNLNKNGDESPKTPRGRGTERTCPNAPGHRNTRYIINGRVDKTPDGKKGNQRQNDNGNGDPSNVRTRLFQ